MEFERTAEDLAALVGRPEAFAAFQEAALRTDVWEEAKADPARFLESRGVRVPERLEVAFSDHVSLRPWPRPEPKLQLVVVRCWWVWSRDPDDPSPPTHFCLEVPEFLLRYL